VGSEPFLNISWSPFFEQLWRNVLELSLLTELGYYVRHVMWMSSDQDEAETTVTTPRIFFFF